MNARNPKPEAPNSKQAPMAEIPNPKRTIRKAAAFRSFEFGSLRFVWDLRFGIWCFFG